MSEGLSVNCVVNWEGAANLPARRWTICRRKRKNGREYPIRVEFKCAVEPFLVANFIMEAQVAANPEYRPFLYFDLFHSGADA